MQQKNARRSNKERTETTRIALIGAARALFVEKGYAETGTPEIVAAAKVTRGALYHHFADKADLLRAVLRREAEAVAAQIEQESRDATSPLDGLMAGAEAYFAAMAADGRARLLLVEGPSVLGRETVAGIDRETDEEQLRLGLALALTGRDVDDATLTALTEILSACFDRAALAIANGGTAADYKAAVRMLLSGLITDGSGEQRRVGNSGT